MSLGRSYWKLWWASTVSNVGDGVELTAIPLLAASLTRDPFVFSTVTVLSRLPWLLFALWAGVIVDRVDRRTLMGWINWLRLCLIGGLALLAALEAASIWILWVVVLAMGFAETVFDVGAQALLPQLVRSVELERANGRLFAGMVTANQFAGPPLGGLLFAAVAAAPFAFDAATFGVAAILVLSIPGSFAPGRAPVRSSVRAEIAEGMRFLWNHRILRAFALIGGLMNAMWMAQLAILALFALEILGLSGLGLGLLLSAAAVGSAFGSLVAPRVVARVGRGPAVISAVVLQAAMSLVVGLTSSPWAVGVMFALFGLGEALWDVVAVSFRQSVVPTRLFGRVNSSYRFIQWGTMPFGALLGGALADALGLRAPWLAAAALLGVAVLFAARLLSTPRIEGARSPLAEPEP